MAGLCAFRHKRVSCDGTRAPDRKAIRQALLLLVGGVAKRQRWRARRNANVLTVRPFASLDAISERWLRVFGLSGLSRPAKIAANVIVVAGFAVTCVVIVHDWFLMDDPSSTSGLLIPFMVAYVTAAVGFVAMLDWASRRILRHFRAKPTPSD
jgi:hypothetical protein